MTGAADQLSVISYQLSERRSDLGTKRGGSGSGRRQGSRQSAVSSRQSLRKLLLEESRKVEESKSHSTTNYNKLLQITTNYHCITTVLLLNYKRQGSVISEQKDEVTYGGSGSGSCSGRKSRQSAVSSRQSLRKLRLEESRRSQKVEKSLNNKLQ